MKPPTRVRKTRVPQTPLIDKEPPKAKQTRNKKHWADGEWKPKERKALLLELNKIPGPTLPRDLPRLQRAVPSRSIAEITKFLDDILKPLKDKLRTKKAEFAATNTKKWIDGCDRHSGTEGPSVSECGEGLVITPHPATSLSSTFREYANNTDCDYSFGESEFAKRLNYSKVYSFFADVIDGKDPFAEWGENVLESAVILEVLADIHNTGCKAKFPEQSQVMWDKYQALKNGDSVDSKEPEEPSSLYQSKILNPLGFTEEQTQSVVVNNTDEGLPNVWYKY